MLTSKFERHILIWRLQCSCYICRHNTRDQPTVAASTVAYVCNWSRLTVCAKPNGRTRHIYIGTYYDVPYIQTDKYSMSLMSGDTTSNLSAKTISPTADTYFSVPSISRYGHIRGHPAPIWWTLRPLFLEGKRPERETGRSQISNAEIDKAVFLNKSSWCNS